MMPISIHAPHTGRGRVAVVVNTGVDISIHAPHTGRDWKNWEVWQTEDLFQSTRPIRGATVHDLVAARLQHIFQSTRPIRGATLSTTATTVLYEHFNPRAPYGARHSAVGIFDQYIEISIHAPHTGRDIQSDVTVDIIREFQSTRPIRGATLYDERLAAADGISIHAPHTGRDVLAGLQTLLQGHFNPRAPYGARRSIGLSR